MNNDQSSASDRDSVQSSRPIEECDGYQKLLAAVEADETKSSGFHDYRAKLRWIVDRAQHYAEETGLSAADILDAWEAHRNYWYMNYYQEANQPEIKGDAVRVFATAEEAQQSIGETGFRCPYCKGVSRSPYQCDSGKLVELMDHPGVEFPCDWKSYGLFGTLGEGAHVFLKDQMRVESVFMPVAWEPANAAVS